jgi:toxin ParE1/3/4
MRVVWLPKARAQREKAIDYIRANNPPAALRQLDEIKRQVSRLAEQPQMGRPGREPNTRELIIVRTPFIAIYTIHGDTVQIIRFLHGAQRRP